MATSQESEFTLSSSRYAAAVASGVIEDGDVLPDSEKKVGAMEYDEKPIGQYYPTIPRFQLELVSPITWETVDIIPLLRDEQVLSITAVDLSSIETTTGKHLLYCRTKTVYCCCNDVFAK